MPAQRIAVIDDEPQMLLMLTSLLETEGFIVDALLNVKDALERFREVVPDLVLLDWELPDMDGVTACGAIRLHIDTRVIMLTARGSETDRVAGFTAGADDYVTKPFMPNELIARIRNALRRPLHLST